MPPPSVEDLLAALAQGGLKKTTPRRAILEVLSALGHGAALDELHARVRGKSPSIGFSTVYRTMRTLVRIGFAREIRLADGIVRYEIGRDEPLRAHFHCRACGLVEELPSARLGSLALAARRLAKGRADSVRIEVAGRCAKCLADLPADRKRR